MNQWKVPFLLAIVSIMMFCLGCSLAREKAGRLTPIQRVETESLPGSRTIAPYRFIAFGDWGAGTQFQKDVAKQTILQYEKAPFDAALLLGDNFYETGDVRKYGKAYFSDMYRPLIDHHVNFIVALGNHDVLTGHQKEQIEFFGMPGYYYTVHKPQIDFFVINTNTFARDRVQRQWLQLQLMESKAPWKIVMGHEPIYSSGEHGYSTSLHETLEPVLIKNKVDLYLAGHDHDYERFQLIHGIQYIVSGGGGAYLRGFPKLMPESLVRKKVHHFLSFELNQGTLRLQVIDKTGQTIDQAQWTKPQQGRLETDLRPTGTEKQPVYSTTHPLPITTKRKTSLNASKKREE